MLQHCRTCQCEYTPDGQGIKLFDETGKEIDLNPPQNLMSELQKKNPEFEEAAGIIISTCCSTAMETRKDPSIAICKACGQPAATWNAAREGWDKYVEPVESVIDTTTHQIVTPPMGESLSN